MTTETQPAQKIAVDLGPRSYDILVQRGALPTLGAAIAARTGAGRTAAVLTQPALARLYLPTVTASLGAAGFTVLPVVLPAGERRKNLRTVSRAYDALLAGQADRRAVVIGLGGGVIGDIAGFVAATYNRGLEFVQAPTTLLAQVDSSVGGKVGVNFEQGKNLIGAFYQPRLVLIDPDTLRSLSVRERRSGLAEVIKYGIIYDKPLFDLLEREGPRLLDFRSPTLQAAIARSCEIKARVVEQDEREEGLRAILNFGHTVGHALEAVTKYAVYTHGEAIAIGMVSASLIGEEMGITRSDDTQRLVSFFRTVGFAAGLDPTLSIDQIIGILSWDKKSVSGSPRFVLMPEIGHVTTGHSVPPATIRRALERQQGLAREDAHV